MKPVHSCLHFNSVEQHAERIPNLRTTVLQACGRASQGSNRATHFYELDIQVKRSPALEESLVISYAC